MTFQGIEPTTMVLLAQGATDWATGAKEKLIGLHYHDDNENDLQEPECFGCALQITYTRLQFEDFRMKLEHPNGMVVWRVWVQHSAGCVWYRKDINHLSEKIRWQHPDRLTSSHIGLFLMLMQGWGPLKPGLFVPFTSSQKALDISIACLFFLTIIDGAAAHPSIPALQHKHGHHRSLHTHCDQRPVPKWSMTFK